MKEILFDSQEFKESSDYTNFVKENSGEGILKIQAYTANQAYPLEGVDIKIFKEINGNKVIFFSGKTDSSGIIDNINLPARPAKEFVNEKADIVYTVYEIEATYPKNNIKKNYQVSIYDNIKVIQPIRILINTLIEGDGNQS